MDEPLGPPEPPEPLPYLGNITRYVATASGCPKTALPVQYNSAVISQSLLDRYRLQAYARDLLPVERVAMCHRIPRPGMDVSVLYAPAHHSSHYGGLMVCGSLWQCPVCAAKITERRRLELQQAVAAWQAGGGYVALASLTLSHDHADNLRDVLARLSRAYRLLRASRWWRDWSAALGLVGYVRSLEVTWGAATGWHPHYHVLFFVPLLPHYELWDALKRQWVGVVTAAGGYATYAAGCDVRYADGAVARYVSKWGVEHELAKGPVKLGRQGRSSPLALLAAYADGDADAGRRWLLYATGMHGQRQLLWSRGLRARLGLADECSDEDLAVAQVDEVAVILASLTPRQWRLVVAQDARGDLLAVARTGDPRIVESFLLDLGIYG